jgi:hypothetical protein
MPDDKSVLGTAPQRDPSVEEFHGWLRSSQTRLSQGAIFSGIVVDNIDPEEQGRVRVLIDALTPKTTTAVAAKWAWTTTQFGGGQRDNGQKRYGSCSPLPVGCKIYLAFEQSDSKYESPIVIGGWYQKESIPKQIFDRKKAGKHVPRAWGWVSPKGHSILTREEDDEESIEIITFKKRSMVFSDKVGEEMITILGKKGGEIQIYEGDSGHVITIRDPGGNAITIEQTSGSINIQSTKEVNISSENITIKASKTLTLKGKTVEIQSQGTKLIGPVTCNGRSLC